MKLRTSNVILFIVFAFPLFSQGQTSKSFRLVNKLDNLKLKPDYRLDTAYINTLNQLATIYADSYPDSALALLSEQIDNCKEASYKPGEIYAYTNMGNAWQTKGDFEKALEYYELAYQMAQKNKLQKAVPGILSNIGLVHANQGDYTEALNKFYEALQFAPTDDNKLFIGSVLNNIAIVHFYQGKMNEADSAYQITLKIAMELKDSIRLIYAYNNIGEVNVEQNKMASALENFHKAYQIAVLKNNPEMLVAITNNLGNTYLKNDSLPQAINQFEIALRLAKQKDYGLATCKALLGLAKVKNQQGLLKEALANGLEGLQKAQEMGQTQLLRDANKVVSDIYEKSGDGMNALKHFKFYMQFSDSLNNIANERAAANEKANYEISQNKIQFEKKSLQQRWLIFSAFAALFTLCIIVWIINRNKKRLNKTNIDLQQKNELIKLQKQEVEETLSKLKAAQAQLIQSEKMASLGDLTAGIAHEIQNPLNFVNNFSEVSNELLDEMMEEADKGNFEEVKEILHDVKQNLEKINHHGKRAGDIVKGMLQHSRTSKGIKEPTDINALANEYLKLAYHGLRAKDKTFNAEMNTDFDESIGKVNIIPQDIGRVLLNLFNNAFYACAERSRASATLNQEGFINLPGLSTANYQPTVSITTKKINHKIQVSVTDNGNGIPQNIVDKIFQPFFTTKPTGQGTGLGLSLSYDIVKAHGGEIKVESKAGEGTTFIIELPVV
ncbi:MAG: tetratricopeptide repeat protein [Ginsengibacter sp.]